MRKKSLKKINILSLILLLAVCVLFGCKKEVQLNDYSLEDLEDKQVMFVFRYINHAWGKQDELWIISKDGTCKVIDFVVQEEYAYIHELEGDKLIEALDECMKNQDIPKTTELLQLSDEQKFYGINVPEISLKDEGNVAMDAGSERYYVVCGTGDKRHMVAMRVDGDSRAWAKDEKINEICDEVGRVTSWKYVDSEYKDMISQRYRGEAE